MGEVRVLRPPAVVEPPAVEPLWRTVAGDRLRTARTGRGETLAQVAGRAGISVQYLSEIERGRKEPSSEVLAAVVGALGLTLVDLTVAVSRELWVSARPGPGPVAYAGGSLALVA